MNDIVHEVAYSHVFSHVGLRSGERRHYRGITANLARV
jgi:hypothetical protein